MYIIVIIVFTIPASDFILCVIVGFVILFELLTLSTYHVLLSLKHLFK